MGKKKKLSAYSDVEKILHESVKVYFTSLR